MSALQHSFSEQTVNQRVLGSTYTAVLSHPSSNFVPGGKYLLFVHALCTLEIGATDDIKMRTAHGGTAFADSEYILEPTNANKRYNYAWFKVWTAVSNEAITFEIACTDPLQYVAAANITIFAARLDDKLVENTDWFYAESPGDVALTLTPQAGASVSFTPTVSTDWLVLTTAQLDVTSITVNYASRQLPTGTYVTSQRWSREGEATTDLLQATIGRVYQELGESLQTFTEQSFNEGGDLTPSGTRLHSAIFALNLNKFRTKAVLYAEDKELLDTTLWDDLLGSLTIFSDIASDTWMLVTGAYYPEVSGAEITHRLTVDEIDQPPDQTTGQYIEEEPADPIDVLHIWRQTLEPSVTVASMAWEAESTISTGGQVGDRLMMAVTMELGGDVPSVAKIPYEAVAFVQAAPTIPYEVA